MPRLRYRSRSNAQGRQSIPFPNPGPRLPFALPPGQLLSNQAVGRCSPDTAPLDGHCEEDAMMGMTSTLHHKGLGMIALSVALLVGAWNAKAHDESKYPDLHGQWTAV